MTRDIPAELRAIEAELARIDAELLQCRRTRARLLAGDGLARILAIPAAELREPPQSAPITGA